MGVLKKRGENTPRDASFAKLPAEGEEPEQAIEAPGNILKSKYLKDGNEPLKGTGRAKNPIPSFGDLLGGSALDDALPEDLENALRSQGGDSAVSGIKKLQHAVKLYLAIEEDPNAQNLRAFASYLLEILQGDPQEVLMVLGAGIAGVAKSGGFQ